MPILQLALAGLLARPPLFAAPDEAGWREHVAQVESEARQRPDDPSPALRLAAGYGKRRRLTEAVEWAKEAGRRGADPLRLALVLGDAHYHANRFEDAAAHYFEVATASPHNSHAHIQLWQCLRAVPQAELAQALDVSRVRALLTDSGLYVPDEFQWPIDPRAAAAATAQGLALAKASDHVGALAQFHKAITADGTHAPAFRGLAKSLSALGERRQSLGAWRLYLSLTPDDNREIRNVRRLLITEERRRGLSAPQPVRKTR